MSVTIAGTTYHVAAARMVRSGRPPLMLLPAAAALCWLCDRWVPWLVLGPLGLSTLLAIAFGKRATSAVAGRAVPYVMRLVDRQYYRLRCELLKGIAGTVLDFGAGGGAYLKYGFRSAGGVHTYIALEPNEHCHAAIRAEHARLAAEPGAVAPRLVLVGEFLDDALASGRIAPGSIDVLILGNVLCEVPAPDAVLAKLHTVLKPGGLVFFSEHVRGQGWRGALQDVLNPWWSLVSDGCNCNRDSLARLQATFGDVTHWTFFAGGGIPWIVPFVVGLAVKRTS